MSYNIAGVVNFFILTALSDSPALSVFALVPLMIVTGMLQQAIKQLVQIHILMNSVARVQVYCYNPSEAALALAKDDEYKKQAGHTKEKLISRKFT